MRDQEIRAALDRHWAANAPKLVLKLWIKAVDRLDMLNLSLSDCDPDSRCKIP